MPIIPQRPAFRKDQALELGMNPALSLLLALAAVLPTGAPAAGHLIDVVPHADGTLRLRATPYQPREGDIVIFSYKDSLREVMYALAGTGAYYHSGLVVRLPSGELATLEAGAVDGYDVFLLTLPTRLPAYQGNIWVRRLRAPLSAAESTLLTDFAVRQTGKGFAFHRVLQAATPFRPRGWLGVKLWGKTDLERSSWFCSELVVAALVAAGRLDGDEVAANGIYPEDLFTDEVIDLHAGWELPLLWSETAAFRRAEQ